MFDDLAFLIMAIVFLILWKIYGITKLPIKIGAKYCSYLPILVTISIIILIIVPIIKVISKKIKSELFTIIETILTVTISVGSFFVSAYTIWSIYYKFNSHLQVFGDWILSLIPKRGIFYIVIGIIYVIFKYIVPFIVLPIVLHYEITFFSNNINQGFKKSNKIYHRKFINLFSRYR